MNTHSTQSTNLLLTDYALNENTIQGISCRFDQLFNVTTTYTDSQSIPVFGLIVNGLNQSEVRLYFIYWSYRFDNFSRFLCHAY